MNALRRLSGTLTIEHVVAGFQKARDQLLALVERHHKKANASSLLAEQHIANAADHTADADRAKRIAGKLDELVS